MGGCGNLGWGGGFVCCGGLLFEPVSVSLLEMPVLSFVFVGALANYRQISVQKQIPEEIRGKSGWKFGLLDRGACSPLVFSQHTDSQLMRFRRCSS